MYDVHRKTRACLFYTYISIKFLRTRKAPAVTFQNKGARPKKILDMKLRATI